MRGGCVRLLLGRSEPLLGPQSRILGLDTLQLKSFARRVDDGYVLKGSKVWTSTAQVAEKILILVRTRALEECEKPSQGLSLFYTDLDRSQVDVQEIPKMGRGPVDSNTLFYEDLKVPACDPIGHEGNGFKMIMHGMSAERILLSAEAIGLGFAALRRAADSTSECVVFGRPIS